MENDYNMRVVNQIKEIRINKSISQLFIAESLNLTVTAYNRIENGKTQLTINNLHLIANTLQVSISDILQFEGSRVVNNNKNIVMTNFNNGNLNITINPQELADALKKVSSN